ncbi:MAG: hypothetical protein A4S09_00425 [Proteobacteria bacterium SG_bin7]|nr:MAG: hypothetical protein A4S09_00425 [Proteobacteria bacterium SG_bin7]
MEVTVSFLDELERKIRDNKAPKLAHLIATIKPGKIPRPLLARYAGLIRRMGGIKYATKLLNPIIRNTAKRPQTSELIEYASCLTRLNLTKESLDILEKIREEKIPEIHYEFAAAYVSNWNYQKAIPYFESYLKFADLSPYKRVVGELNLGASYIYVNKFKEAKRSLEKVYAVATKEGFNLLAGNSCELMGEISIIENDFKKAFEYLDKAKIFLENTSSRYKLFVDKWLLVIKMLREQGSPESLRTFQAVRKSAAEFSQWNTVQELEMFKAIACNDSEKVHYCYYGTSYPELRKRVACLWGKPIENLEIYDRRIGSGPAKKKDVFDVASGRDHATGAKLKTGQNLHRLMQALSMEVYFPFSTTKLYSLVFPNLQFNPVTSPQQIYEVIKRLNLWFVENKVPLNVDRSRGGYRLRALQPYILRLKTNNSPLTKVEEFLLRIKDAGIKSGFTIGIVEEKLRLPRRSATRLLGEAVAAGLLRREGQTQSTRYFFSS